MANELAYGFVQLSHLGDERVTEVGVSVVMRAVEESLAEYNRMINALMGQFVQRTTDHKRRYKLAGGGTLQPLDENGIPQPVRPSGYYDVAWPIQGGGDAWATNRVSRALLTVDEANRFTLDSLKRDADWNRRHILAACFDNTTWTYEDDVFGDLTIQPLANGDTVEYVRRGGATSTDDHYLAQASSIDDANNPFDDIYDELMEHPSNSGPIVVYIPTNLKSSVTGLTDFTEIGDPDIDYGTGVNQIVGDPDMFDDTIRGFGDEVLGKVGKCWVVEWIALPDSYMLAHARGAGPVLAMREYDAPELRGFFPENHSPDGNIQEMRMIRYAGYGALNRVAAVVQRIGNASYAIPSGYTNPLAV
jgi:hypothetical protein